MRRALTGTAAGLHERQLSGSVEVGGQLVLSLV